MWYLTELLLFMHCLAQGKEAVDAAHADGVVLIADEL